MKKSVFLLAILFQVTTASFGQWMWNIDFEDPSVFDRIFIDTNANPNNIWQIGTPSKILFNSAFSPNHVILTDSIGSYPTNDTSSFIIRHERWHSVTVGANTLLLLDFYFKMDADSLTDFGRIEVSQDNGDTWFDVMTLDTLIPLTWLEPKPVLTGTQTSWTHFSLDLRGFTAFFGYSDTLLYKFTFISDDIQTNKEGWMIDDFLFEDIWMGIEGQSNNRLISILPNPASRFIKIEKENYGNNETANIIDLAGRELMIIQHYKGEPIDIGALNPGTYLVKYFDREGMVNTKFVVTR